MPMDWPGPALKAVVIGASAGGVEALLALTAALPADFPAPVLVVLHRAPQPEGKLSPAALLARRCALPVEDAWAGQPLKPGRVLLAPADYHLLVDPGPDGPVAALSVDDAVLWSRPAIDPLFESAAHEYGAGLLAIVLTGASADGAAGALAVRAHGGRLWVQDPAEAVVPTMPQAALDLAGADQVMSLNMMCDALGRTRAGGER
ncbi:MAG TPA: chemotaxis protein CheB [Ideonella sp.]|nr:chemotaxis protein CheB [Ideonella sp.]HSI47241.1 chemotaxis protein CheB [Ideonella sp.]